MFEEKVDKWFGVEGIRKSDYESLPMEDKIFLDYLSHGYFENGHFIPPQNYVPKADGQLLHQLNYASSPRDWYLFGHDLLSEDASYVVTGFNPKYHISTDSRFEIGLSLPAMPDDDHSINPVDHVLAIQGEIGEHSVLATGDGSLIRVDGILIYVVNIRDVDDIPHIVELAIKAKLDPRRHYVFKAKKQKFVKLRPKHSKRA